MFAINATRDLRNQIVCFAVDAKEYAHKYPMITLSSLGMAPIVYAECQWYTRCIQWLSSFHRQGSPLFFTTQKPTLPPPISRWRWNPISWIPIQSQIPFLFALHTTPSFKGYEIALPKNHPCKGAGLLSTSLRPANFLIDAFFKGTSINVTKPHRWFANPFSKNPALFAFTSPYVQVSQFIEQQMKEHPNEVISFSADGIPGTMDNVSIDDLSEVYGSKKCSFSRKEISQIVESQEIFLSPHLPLAFYKGLKEAMTQDGIVILPECLLGNLRSLQSYLFLQKVAKDPTFYGFQNEAHFSQFQKLSMYAIGAMVIKSQKFHVLVDGDGKILDRKANTQDHLQLIDLCGIRDQHTSTLDVDEQRALMKETFKTALSACKEGFALFPAVGMGVWQGNPRLYWPALLDAIRETDVPLRWIGVNPAHAPTPFGKYKGCSGGEFQWLLEGAILQAKKEGDKAGLARLQKVHNLHETKKDIVQLARSLKLHYPNETVSLINASDPDVTLGNHVGEYTNTITHSCSTTEENYAALGTTAFCFEGITGIQKKMDHIFQT